MIMKLLLLCALISTITAKPDGYYRQEYQFKKSSSTFQNNELQTKNEDEGFYAKHGDLEGKTAPKVNQHSEHREFVNPKLDGVGHTVTTYGNRDLTQEAENVFANHGMASNPSNNYGGGQSRSYSSFSSYSTSGSNQPKTYVTHSNLGQLTQNLEYDLAQQLRDATAKYNTNSINTEEFRILENELKANLTRQLNEALYNKYGRQGQSGSFSYSISTSGGYNPQANYDNQELTDLRNQLEQNLIKQLRTTTHYQTGTSYVQTNHRAGEDINNRRFNTHRRDSEEIEDLNKQAPRSYYPQSNYNQNEDLQQNTERISYASALNSKTSVNPKASIIPETSHSSGIRTDYSNTYRLQSGSHQQQYNPHSYNNNYPELSHTTERIVIQPSITITDVAQRVQNDLSQQLHEALRSHEEKYTSSDYLLTHTRPSYQDALDNFKRDVLYNLTRQFNEELQRNYGNQVQRGEYSFSTGSRTVANYRLNDFNSLKKQVEDNLINHLESTFRQQENRYVRTQQTQTKTYHSQSPVYTRTFTDENANSRSYTGGYSQHSPVYTRPLTENEPAMRNSHTQTRTNYQNNPELQQITNQVQDDLTQKIQRAVQQQRSSYTTSYTDQNNQDVINELTEELRQNLTKSLDESLRERYGKQGTRGGYSYSVSTSGTYSPKANYNREDLNALMSQMQADLERQLREQMSQQSYQSQSHYSSYSPVRYTTYRTNNYYPSQSQSGSFQKYEQFNSGYQTQNTENLEDCMQGDAPAAESENLGQQIQSTYENKPAKEDKLERVRRAISYSKPHQDLSQLPQQEDDYEDIYYGNYHQQQHGGYRQLGPQYQKDFDKFHVGQQVDPMSQLAVEVLGLSQQTEEEFDKLHVNQGIGQQPEDDFEKLQVRQQIEDDFGQLHQGQQVEDDFGQLHQGQQVEDDFVQLHQGQQVEDDFVQLHQGQQVEDDFGKLQHGQQVEDDYGQFQLGQQVDDGIDKLQVEQQVEDGFNKLQIGQQVEDDFGQMHVGQQVEDDYGKPQIGQQPEDDFEKLQVGQQIEDGHFQAANQLGQQIEDDYQILGQEQIGQTDDYFGKLHDGNIFQTQNQDEKLGQQIEDSDILTQMIEDLNFTDNHQGQQIEEGQQIEDLGQLTQQLEDEDYGNLQVANQNEQDFSNSKISYKPQSQDNFDVGQQIDDSQISAQQNEKKLEQQEDLTQQIENFDNPKHTEEFGKLQLQNSHSNTEENTTPKSNLEFLNSDELTQQLPQDFFGNLQNRTNHTTINKAITHMQTNANSQPSRAISLGDAHRTYISRPVDAHSPREIDVSNKRNEIDLTQQDDLQLTQQVEQPFQQQTRPYLNGNYYGERNTQQQEVYSPSRTIYFSRPVYTQTPNSHSFPQTQNDYRTEPPMNIYPSSSSSGYSHHYRHHHSRNHNSRFEHSDDSHIEEIAPPKIYRTYSSGYNKNSDDIQRVETDIPQSSYHSRSSGYNYNRDDAQQVEEIQPQNSYHSRSSGYNYNRDDAQQVEEIQPQRSYHSRSSGYNYNRDDAQQVEEIQPQSSYHSRSSGYNYNRDDAQQVEEIQPQSSYHSRSSGYNRDDAQQVEEIKPNNWQTNYRNNKFETSDDKQIENDQISEDDDLQQEIEPVAVPNSYPQGRRMDDSDAVVVELAEETTPQTGFWKRFGGKISNTYNSAKQKAKDLVEKINL